MALEANSRMITSILREDQTAGLTGQCARTNFWFRGRLSGKLTALGGPDFLYMNEPGRALSPRRSPLALSCFRTSIDSLLP